MVALLCRPQERVFPSISANLYSLSCDRADLTTEQQAACKLLNLIEQKYSGSRLDVLGRFGHLLRQHQQAIASELESKWQRADFFWREVQVELKNLVAEREVWQDLALTVAGGHSEAIIMNNPVKLRQLLLHELFIDTHCAFYNGLIQNVTKPSWNERAFVHIDYIQQLLELSVIDGEEVKNLLAEAWQTRINACKEAKKWQLAIKYCQQRLKYLPHNIDFQDELAEIHYLAALEHVTNENVQIYHASNIKYLKKGINQLEKYLKKYPYSLKNFEMLSFLYRLRAVNLARNEQLAEALVCGEKAITYNPYSEQAVATRNELIDIMEQLQQQMNQLLAPVENNSRSFSAESAVVFTVGLLINPLGTLISSANNNTSQLNEKGEKLLAEAKQGFIPINAYIDSEEKKETENAFFAAQAIYLWHQIGLLEPSDGWLKFAEEKGGKNAIESTGNLINTALQLQEAVHSLLQEVPQAKEAIQPAWKKLVETKPDLADLDSALICDYLKHILFGEEREHNIFVATSTGNVQATQVLTPVSTKGKFSMEPFIPWVLSSQDKRIKIQAVLAGILILASGFVMMREKTTFVVRKTAFQQILTASQVQNDQAVLKASKSFFQNGSIFNKDERATEIKELFTESLLRWFPQQSSGEKLTLEQEEYLQLHKQLQKDFPDNQENQ
ncbi:hypothetical protein [Calothrix sp. PCC 6303]|uniref:hypothetical protein n=1 Tax=Calothrix sp. PCC 6303 TaxID=1170562 RepID=UPI0002A00AA9|nr:hypothetical protein [Calothrix sp. PCC 6303]AFY99351.1 Tetratricopeptide TPR_1 repeat-containing protein [Calothrix sp. PCC 6303]